MLRRAVTKINLDSIAKPVLTRQLGLHKWSAAEECVRDKYACSPGRYIVSHVADYFFCIDVNQRRELRHVVLPSKPTENVIDLTG